MNHITIELCAEDRARLDAILEALKKGAETTQNAPKAETQPKTQAEPKQKAQPAPAVEAAPVETVEPEKVEAQPQLEDIQRLVVTLATSGKKAEARDIVKAYADRVTEIRTDKYAEVYEKLKALEA